MRQWTLKAKLRLALALMWLGLIGVGIWRDRKSVV